MEFGRMWTGFMGMECRELLQSHRVDEGRWVEEVWTLLHPVCNDPQHFEWRSEVVRIHS